MTTKKLENGGVFWCEQCHLDIRPQNVSFHRYDRVHNVITLEKDPRDTRISIPAPKRPTFRFGGLDISNYPL